jgi:hypothetical protein
LRFGQDWSKQSAGVPNIEDLSRQLTFQALVEPGR